MKSKKMSQRAYQVLAALIGVGLLVVLGFSLKALFASHSQQVSCGNVVFRGRITAVTQSTAAPKEEGTNIWIDEDKDGDPDIFTPLKDGTDIFKREGQGLKPIAIKELRAGQVVRVRARRLLEMALDGAGVLSGVCEIVVLES